MSHTAATRMRNDPPSSIASPEPDLTPEEIVQRAESLCAVLRERQPECEGSGCLPELTNRDFNELGFYRILQPRYFGGYEFDLPTFMKVLMAVSRGCSESGWVLALIAGHPNLLARWPLEGQREAYGTSGEFRGPGVAMATGTARVVKESSGSGVELKQAAESVATPNGPALGTERYVWRRE
jgi:3-hydroxy-9,10-secoandrosta-1,3,5(10)-triene-9,17-dione monooxygenase